MGRRLRRAVTHPCHSSRLTLTFYSITGLLSFAHQHMHSFTTRVGLAFATNNMLAALGLSQALAGPERNREALAKHVSAYPALLEDLVCVVRVVGVRV